MMEKHLIDDVEMASDEDFIEFSSKDVQNTMTFQKKYVWMASGFVIILFVITIVSLMVAVTRGKGHHSEQHDQPPMLSSFAPPREHRQWGPESRTTVVLSKPEVVPAGQRIEFFQQIDRAKFGLTGDLMIKELSFRILDADTQQAVPLEWIYNHHIFVGSDRNQFTTLMAWGAEGPLSDTTTFEPAAGLFLENSENLMIGGEWIDVYGKLATINQTALAEIKISFIPLHDASAVEAAKANRLNYQFFGAGMHNQNAEIAIPPGPLGEATCISSSDLWDYDSIRVYQLVGHIHVGGINETLTDESDGRVLAFTTPVLDQYGYVVRLNTTYTRGFELQRGRTYTTKVCYANRKDGYAGVMGLWAGYYENLEHPGLPAFPMQ